MTQTRTHHNQVWENGVLIYEEVVEVPLVASLAEATEALSRLTAEATLIANADKVDPDHAYIFAPLLPAWSVGEAVTVGGLRSFEGTVYEVVQVHTTQADWTPPVVPALWKVWRNPDAAPQPWVQPAGAQDAYQIGDRVTHQGQTWESTAANNVWAPGVFGWTVVP